MLEHDLAEDHAVGVLLGRDAGVVRVGKLAEVIERAAHIDFLFERHIEQRQIDRAAAAVAGMLGNITLREQHVLVKLRIEEFLHPRIVGVERPVHKVRDRHLRAIRVENLQPVAHREQLVADLLERGGGFLGEERQRLLIAVDPVADEVVGRIIADLQNRIRHGFRKQHKVRAVVRKHDGLRLMRGLPVGQRGFERLVRGRFALGHAVAVDRGPVVFHRDRDPVELVAQRKHLVRLGFIAVLALEVVAAEHEGQAAVGVAACGILGHAAVAGAVAERQNRLYADLLRDHRDLVHFQILDEEVAAEDQLVIVVEHVGEAVLAVLVPRHNRFIRADDLSHRQAERGIVRNAAHDQTIRAADDVNGEVVRLEVFHDLQHRLIPALAAQHPVVARHRELLEVLNIGVELVERHARKRGRDALAVIDLEALEGGAGEVLLDDLHRGFALKVARLVDVIRVLQYAMH